MGYYNNIKVLKDSYQHLTTISESEKYFDLFPFKKDLPTNLDEKTLRLVEKDLENRKRVRDPSFSVLGGIGF